MSTSASPTPRLTSVSLAPSPTFTPALTDHVRLVRHAVAGAMSSTPATPPVPYALRAIALRAGTTTITVTAEDLDLRVTAGDLHQLTYNHARLQAIIARLAQLVLHPAHVEVRSDDHDAPHFVLVPGEQLDDAAAQTQIDAWLQTPVSGVPVLLSLVPNTKLDHRPDPAQLQQQIEALAQHWDGIAGIEIEDTNQERMVAALHQDSVFSGASVLKVAVLLQMYLTTPRFNEEQDAWMEDMIVNSNNIAANQLLAASAGGESANDAARGAQALTQMLRDLGLQHTYLATPYEDDHYPLDFTGLTLEPGPDEEGEPPFTVADPWLRATPAEIAHLFSWIDACSRGTGVLLQHFSDKLTAARCTEMIARLERNGDQTRMMAGLPEGIAVAHKSGWIDDTQADVGVVYSPGGTFTFAAYLYADTHSSTAGTQPAMIADLARLVYSYYNPDS